jgi:hypothetical protein
MIGKISLIDLNKIERFNINKQFNIKLTI